MAPIRFVDPNARHRTAVSCDIRFAATPGPSDYRAPYRAPGDIVRRKSDRAAPASIHIGPMVEPRSGVVGS
jgi:hypothetical protein